jgi:hypothetical protein
MQHRRLGLRAIKPTTCKGAQAARGLVASRASGDAAQLWIRLLTDGAQSVAKDLFNYGRVPLFKCGHDDMYTYAARCYPLRTLRYTGSGTSTGPTSLLLIPSPALGLVRLDRGVHSLSRSQYSGSIGGGSTEQTSSVGTT